MTANAQPKPDGPCIGYGVNHSTPADVRTTRMRALIRCTFDWVGLPNDVDTAQYVADRESGYYPWAYNPSGCAGLYQHMTAYWPSRVQTYLKSWWFPKTWPDVSVYNPRANALVAASMVRAGGWQPWSIG
jgi:hypothetical protein